VLVLARWRAVCFDFFQIYGEKSYKSLFYKWLRRFRGDFENEYFLEVFRIFWQTFGKMQTF
jgi:hypothetical protein